MTQIRIAASAISAFAAAAVAAAAPAMAGSATTAWDEGYRSKARLHVGAVPTQAGKRVVAGVEIAMLTGWKTYWRNPGDAGGIPPYFDWSKSENLKSATVQFPAPSRFTDSTGTTIGYKGAVTLPIVIEPVDPNRDVGLAVTVEFGVCQDICIPARARLAVKVDPKSLTQVPAPLARALDRVPVPQDSAPKAVGQTPRLVAANVVSGPQARIVFDVAYPGGVAGADLFVEGKPGAVVPVAKPVGKPANGKARFMIPLGGDLKQSDLKSLPLKVTMVSDAASSETTIHLNAPR